MRILVTNDDGVNSYTLKVLVNVAKKYGEVICIAPSSLVTSILIKITPYYFL